MVESSVEDLAGNSPHRSPHQMVLDRIQFNIQERWLSFQDSQDKCCSIEMVEEPEEKFRFRYKSEMQVKEEIA